MPTGETSPLAKLGILLTASIVVAIGGAHYHMIGAMVQPLGKAYGWSRGEVTFALTLFALIHPITGLMIGWLADRVAVRKIAIPGIVAFAAGTFLLGLAGPALWTWYAAYVLFAFLCIGASPILWTKLIVTHFRERRGLALAVTMSGAGVIVSVVPGMVLLLDNAFGVRGVYTGFGIGVLALMLVPALLFLPKEETPQTISAQTISAPARDVLSWREILHSHRLWRLAVAFFILAMCVGTFIGHFQSMLSDAGMSRETAAKVALAIGPGMIVGRLATGFLFDTLPTRLVAAFAVALPGVACLLLLLVPLDVQNATLIAVFIGLGIGSEVDVIAYLTSRYFGTRQYGMIYSILMTIYGSGIGVAAWIIAKAYDATHSYDAPLTALALAIPVAVLLVLSLGKPPENVAD